MEDKSPSSSNSRRRSIFSGSIEKISQLICGKTMDEQDNAGEQSSQSASDHIIEHRNEEENTEDKSEQQQLEQENVEKENSLETNNEPDTEDGAKDNEDEERLHMISTEQIDTEPTGTKCDEEYSAPICLLDLEQNDTNLCGASLAAVCQIDPSNSDNINDKEIHISSPRSEMSEDMDISSGLTTEDEEEPVMEKQKEKKVVENVETIPQHNLFTLTNPSYKKDKKNDEEERIQENERDQEYENNVEEVEEEEEEEEGEDDPEEIARLSIRFGINPTTNENSEFGISDRFYSNDDFFNPEITVSSELFNRNLLHLPPIINSIDMGCQTDIQSDATVTKKVDSQSQTIREKQTEMRERDMQTERMKMYNCEVQTDENQKKMTDGDTQTNRVLTLTTWSNTDRSGDAVFQNIECQTELAGIYREVKWNSVMQDETPQNVTKETKQQSGHFENSLVPIPPVNVAPVPPPQQYQPVINVNCNPVITVPQGQNSMPSIPLARWQEMCREMMAKNTARRREQLEEEEGEEVEEEAVESDENDYETVDREKKKRTQLLKTKLMIWKRKMSRKQSFKVRSKLLKKLSLGKKIKSAKTSESKDESQAMEHQILETPAPVNISSIEVIEDRRSDAPSTSEITLKRKIGPIVANVASEKVNLPISKEKQTRKESDNEPEKKKTRNEKDETNAGTIDSRRFSKRLNSSNTCSEDSDDMMRDRHRTGKRRYISREGDRDELTIKRVRCGIRGSLRNATEEGGKNKEDDSKKTEIGDKSSDTGKKLIQKSSGSEQPSSSISKDKKVVSLDKKLEKKQEVTNEKSSIINVRGRTRSRKNNTSEESAVSSSSSPTLITSQKCSSSTNIDKKREMTSKSDGIKSVRRSSRHQKNSTPEEDVTSTSSVAKDKKEEKEDSSNNKIKPNGPIRRSKRSPPVRREFTP